MTEPVKVRFPRGIIDRIILMRSRRANRAGAPPRCSMPCLLFTRRYPAQHEYRSNLRPTWAQDSPNAVSWSTSRCSAHPEERDPWGSKTKHVWAFSIETTLLLPISRPMKPAFSTSSSGIEMVLPPSPAAWAYRFRYYFRLQYRSVRGVVGLA